MNIKSLIWPRNRLQRAGIIVLGATILYTLLGFFLVPKIIGYYAESVLTEQLNRQTRIEQVRFNPYRFSCEISGLTIEKKGGEGNWVAVDSLLVNLQAASAYKRALVLSRLRIQGPRISMTRYADNSYNFSDLLSRESDADTAEEDQGEEGEPFRYSINNIEILSATVELEDDRAQARHTLSNLEFSLPTISNFPYAVETFVQPSLSGQINQMDFDLKGRSKPFARSRQSGFNMVVDELSLQNYLHYLPGERNFSLTDGRLSTDLRVTYAHPEQEVPYLRLEGSMELSDLEIILAEGEERSFCTIPSIRLEVGDGNLLSGDFELTDLQILEPRLNLVRRGDGSFFLPALNTGANEEAPEEKASSAQTQDTGFFSFTLDHMLVRSGSVKVRDQSVSPTFTTTLQPVSLEMSGLKTGSDDAATFQLEMQTDKEETLAANGSLTTNPMRVDAETSLSNIGLTSYTPYFDPYVNGTVNKGRCDLGAEISFQLGDTVNMELTGMRLGLEGVSVSDATGQEVLALSEFSFREARVLPSQREIGLGSVSLKDFDLKVGRKADGGLNLTELVAAAPADGSSGESAEQEEESWKFVVDEVNIQGGETVYTDTTFASEMRMDVSEISCRLEQLSNRQDHEAALEASLRIGDRAALDLQGEVGITPLQVSLDLALSRLDLKPLQPLVQEFVSLGLDKGFVDLTGKINVLGSDASRDFSVSFDGDTAIREVSLSEAKKERDLVAWKDLRLQGVQLASSRPSLSVEEIDFKGLDTHMIVDEEGGLNIQKLLPSGDSSEQNDDGQQESGSGFMVLIERFRLRQGSLKFEDQSVSPRFQASLGDMRCDMENISNQEGTTSDISFRGDLGGHAPLQLEGSFNLLEGQFFADLEVSLSNMSLSPFSPYSVRYIGYAISKGKFFLDSSIRIEGTALESKHSLRLDQLSLGAEVESPQAVNAPVKLGIALLKDRQGQITIDKTVGGDLSDPEFTVGDLVMRVFVSVLVKAAQSPFAALGALVPGGGEDINQVLFAPGQSSLDGEAKEKLEKLGKALYERPELQVDVLGTADTSRDRETLHEAWFSRLLRRQKYLDLSEEERSETSIEKVRVTQEEYEKYLWQAYQAASMEKPTNFLGGTEKLPPEELEQRLRSHISVEPEDLRELAASRADRVMGYLREAGPVSSERIFREKPELGSDGKDAYTRAEIQIR
ncbi:MAG: DUF748 domain-containing protein [Desulfovermiculus sp.]|nr:DUF748 domain-containing protein [Desulfovermiculus sp.]